MSPVEKAPLTNPHDPRIIAARWLLQRGVLTTAEVARFMGVTRQHIHRLTKDLHPVKRRARYLQQKWKEALEQAQDI
jgi:hypothetical protein